MTRTTPVLPAPPDPARTPPAPVVPPAPAPGPRRPAPGLRQRLWSLRVRSVTGRIYLVAGVTVAALALLFASLAVAVVQARDGLRVIGHDAGPQVVATANLYFALSDMDAQVASLLLMGDEYAARRPRAREWYEERRTDAGSALLEASELAGDDAVERRTVQDVLDGLGRYERLAARALLLAEQADYPAGSPPPEVVAAYREATDLMSRELLPQAYNLTLESGTVVRQTHDGTHSAVVLGRAVVAVGGVAALGCLVWLQVFLARRFHRRLAPVLLVATAVTAMYTLTGVTVLGKEADALRTAKEDGFDTVLALARAHAVGNSMFADQSRYLLDPGRADTYQQAYLDKAQSLLSLQAGDLAGYHAALPGVDERYTAGGGIPGLLGAGSGIPDRVRADAEEGSYLDLPQGPVPFSEVTRVLRAYEGFQRGDRELRTLVGFGETRAAATTWLGTVTSRFGQYDRALVELTGLHRDVSQTAVADGEDALDGMEFLLPVAMLVIAVMVVAGVVPRLREYR